MQYTILELERIEKVLGVKRGEAEEAYAEYEHYLLAKFSKHWDSIPRQGDDLTHLEAKKALWKKWQDGSDKLKFLRGEVELFQSGIDTLYSYWNSAVEIFIDNLRTKMEKEIPELKRYVINPGADGKGQYP